jgi:hypothetical protein
MPNVNGPHSLNSRSDKQAGWPARLAPWLLILGLVAFHAANNWIWLTKNSVIPGWDRPAHLGRSLAYYETLTPLSWQGLFQASLQDPIRPPLFFASATPLYWAFDLSPDVAVMVNVVYWLILIGSVYGFGAHLRGPGLGTWGAVLTALVPSDGFRRRGSALAFGVALGLGMLTKRTYAVFVVVPVAVAILRSGVFRALWDRLRGGLRVSFSGLLIALGGGVALAGLWYFPNRTVAQDLTLGLWLFPVWAALIAATIPGSIASLP